MKKEFKFTTFTTLNSAYYKVIGSYISVCKDRLNFYFDFPDVNEITIILSTVKFDDSYKLTFDHYNEAIRIECKDREYSEWLSYKADKCILEFMRVNKVKSIYVGVEYD